MKHTTLLLIFSSMLSVATTAGAAGTDNPCVQQRAEILKQIDQAKLHGNSNRVAGLNKALAEQEANCSPESIKKARELDVAKARGKVAERERELQKVKNEGRSSDKIAKRELKLKEAQVELERAQKALDN